MYDYEYGEKLVNGRAVAALVAGVGGVEISEPSTWIAPSEEDSSGEL